MSEKGAAFREFPQEGLAIMSWIRGVVAKLFL